MRGEAGFTLIEVLAALVVGSLLLAALTWTMGGLGADLHARPRDAELKQVAVAAPQLTALLAAALPPATGGSGFVGDARHLQLHTAPPQSLGAIGVMTLELLVSRSASGEALDLMMVPDDASVRLPAALTKRRLADGFATIDFSYAPRAKSLRKTLPRLITITFKTHGGRSASIVVEPRITSDGDCWFDPISMACRA